MWPFFFKTKLQFIIDRRCNSFFLIGKYFWKAYKRSKRIENFIKVVSLLKTRCWFESKLKSMNDLCVVDITHIYWNTNVHIWRKTFFLAMTNFNFHEWKRKRTWSYINCCVIAFLNGLSLTIYTQTEYLYFKNTLLISNPESFYGLSFTIVCFGRILFTILPLYWTDKTRKVRKITFIFSILSLVGNILYTYYLSAPIVLLGQFLCGALVGNQVINFGEIARIYEPEKITRISTVLAMFHNIGLLCGPCLTYIFILINANIGAWALDGTWRITLGNMPGITMCCLTTIHMCIRFLTFHDVSSEYYLKCGASKNEENSANEENKQATMLNMAAKYLSIVISNRLLLTLILTCFVTAAAGTTLYLLEPIRAIEYLNWDQGDLAKFNFILIVIYTMFCYVATGVLINAFGDYWILLLCINALIISILLMAVLPIFPSHRLFIFSSCFIASGIYDTLFIIASRAMVAKCVPECIQTTAEGLRISISQLGNLTAGTTLVIFLHFPSSILVLSGICFLFLCVYCVQYKCFWSFQIITDTWESFMKWNHLTL